MIEVVRAFDRAPIAEIANDDRAALDRKLDSASRVFADRGEWLPTPRRIHILRRIAELMEGKREHLGRQIALEGGKPLSDALVETDRAIDGVRNAACRRPAYIRSPGSTMRSRGQTRCRSPSSRASSPRI